MIPSLSDFTLIQVNIMTKKARPEQLKRICCNISCIYTKSSVLAVCVGLIFMLATKIFVNISRSLFRRRSEEYLRAFNYCLASVIAKSKTLSAMSILQACFILRISDIGIHLANWAYSFSSTSNPASEISPPITFTR